MRWDHPEFGLLAPDQFISIAEHTGAVKPLTIFVLERAIQQCAEWRRQGYDLHVAVNLPAINLQDPRLVGTISRLLKRHALPPGRLSLEIVESTVMSDPIRALRVLSRLRELGTRISVDDFGTGYSSLTYLKRLPIHEIKIDKSFVLDLANNADDALIVNSVIDLGRNLGLRVVAEGVEGPDVLELLVQQGCHLAQGYFFSRPLPPRDLEKWLDDAGLDFPQLQKQRA